MCSVLATKKYFTAQVLGIIQKHASKEKKYLKRLVFCNGVTIILYMQTERTHQAVPAKGFRESTSGDLACPHRDVSCCRACAAAHKEIVLVFGQHFWTVSEGEKQELLQAMSSGGTR